jgi:orotate phosphoribosyltransferase
MTERERLLRLLVERSVRLGHFVLASGARSTHYVDCRTTTTHAEGLYLVGRLGFAALPEPYPDAIGGLTMGADPVACAIAHASWMAGKPVHAFSVRKEAKAHGTGRRIEGSFIPGQRVVIVEDVITSGGSALRACEAVQAEGGEVVGVLALVDREGGGREAIEAAGYPLRTLFGISELLAASERSSTSVPPRTPETPQSHA